jgi:hypothetical protein
MQEAWARAYFPYCTEFAAKYPFPLLWKAQTLRQRYCVAWCEVHQENLDCHLGNMDDMLENEMDESDELRGLVHEVNNSS